MRRVLIVAYYFPPLGGIGSIRTNAYARHLPTFGWEPTVLAPRNGAYFRDPDLDMADVEVVRTASLEMSRLGKTVLRTGGDDTNRADVGNVRAAMRDVARRTLYFPDGQLGWLAPAVLTARRRLRGRHFDAIFSTSFPVTAHLVARRLHRWLGAPWVAEFRDPWSKALVARGAPSGRAAKLERELAQEADAVVMTSPTWASEHATAWQRDVRVITNGCDGDLRPAVAAPSEFVVGYLGTFYPETQRLSAVWRAIAQVNAAASGQVDRIRVIGEPHPSLVREVAQYGLSPVFEATGFVSHGRVRAELARVSALLLAGPADASGLQRGHIVAKVFEYLESGRPVIYVGDPACDVVDLLRQHQGCHIVNTDDVRGLIAALEAVRDEPVIERDLTGLTRHVLTGRLAEVLDDAGVGHG